MVHITTILAGQLLMVWLKTAPGTKVKVPTVHGTRILLRQGSRVQHLHHLRKQARPSSEQFLTGAAALEKCEC
eukprot:9375971-Prorocentrum_lima.AAC.1